MAEEDNKKKSPFSIYWIYALIGIGIIGYTLFTSSFSVIPVKSQTIFYELAKKGYIQEAKVINKVRLDFKVNQDGKNFIANTQDAKYKNLKEDLKKSGTIKKGDPVFELNIIEVGNFETEVKEINEEIEKTNVSLLAAKKKPLPTVGEYSWNSFTNFDSCRYLDVRYAPYDRWQWWWRRRRSDFQYR
jgi:ribosomal protein S8